MQAVIRGMFGISELRGGTRRRVLIVTFVTFALLNLLPGDVSLELLGSDATPSAIARWCRSS